MPLQPGVNELAPLPPQPLEALVLVDGIEAQRTALSLAPGQWAQLDIDPIAHAVARQLSVDLTLRLIARGSETPVESVQVLPGLMFLPQAVAPAHSFTFEQVCDWPLPVATKPPPQLHVKLPTGRLVQPFTP